MQARMRLSSLIGVVAGALVVFLGGTVLAQSSNSEVGTWKLNIAKSTLGPGPAIKSGITTIEAAGAGVKQTVDNVYEDGSVRHWESTANYDGKDNRVTGNNPNYDMIARTRTNATTTKAVNKKGGKTISTQTVVVSSDGKTRTVTTTATNGQVNNVLVFAKQ